ncbi:hypothetical protein [Cupriavidus numazuensis]|uniref:hypothetical protein n=1 Tax=Cupriavidus numazuensis TaxID=221992 RepID=UPI001FD5B6CF|nr:hypothetical protein [Cupriavidus numazuensis]
MSSAIVSFDADEGVGTTVSGRRYILSGCPGFTDDAEYVWHLWKRVNGVTLAKDVTNEYSPPANAVHVAPNGVP